ncbi:MAG: zinc ribbon domain-containing protein [Candidatus Eremiobacterota bacterium]
MTAKKDRYPLKELAICSKCRRSLTLECSGGTRYYKCTTHNRNQCCNSSSIDAGKLEKNIEVVLKEKMSLTYDEPCQFLPDSTWLAGINNLYKKRYELDKNRPDFEKLFEIYTRNIKVYLNNLIQFEEKLLKNKPLWYQEDYKKYTCEDLLIFVKKITVDLENKDLDVDFGQLGHSHMLIR